ncbi:MAG: histidine--tRNA ligase [Gammaproteobacteria bacterium]|nr:histidine--tRNA ligase [Gammaproteobacteria bacterium]
MADIIQAIRGMNDFLPPETFLWQHAEYVIRKVLQGYGFQEIRFPIVEKTDLFKRSIGEVTDIVEKEMYTFLDRNEDSLTLRPEGTAGCVRAGIEHGLLYNQVQRLWYGGPFFRHERPQKGRYRQFSQCGAEIFGLSGPDIDAELILMSSVILDKLGLRSSVKLEINTLGTPLSRQNYRKELIRYFEKNKKILDEDSTRRLETNPMRILDSKNPSMKALIANAPKLIDFLDEESANHFEALQELLTQLKIPFEINTHLVRGLDYYTKTVFEWVTDKLGAQGAICSGGRYDGLVEQLGGKPTPALGFAIGMDRTVLLLQQLKKSQKDTYLHAYLVTEDMAAYVLGLKLADYLRSKIPSLHLIVHAGGGPLKNQLKRADKSGATYAIIIGEHERKIRAVSLKSLRENLPQQTMYQDELAEYLKLKITKHK